MRGGADWASRRQELPVGPRDLGWVATLTGGLQAIQSHSDSLETANNVSVQAHTEGSLTVPEIQTRPASLFHLVTLTWGQ